MSRLQIEGVFGATNAFTIHDDGRFAYLFDPRVDATIRIDVSTGSRDVLKWDDRSFHHRRWLCYCLFTIEREGTVFLPTLFYNTKRRNFYLITFVLDNTRNVLYSLKENVISMENIRLDRFSYNAHKDGEKLHIFFYERFIRHSDTMDSPTSSLTFVHCSFDCRSTRLTTRRGALPIGQWELPFFARNSIHFISTELSVTQIASLPENADLLSANWSIQAVSPEEDDGNPPRKAVWCNAWRNDFAWYIISEKITNDQGITRNICLWQLDVQECRWRKVPITFAAPQTASNFSLRITLNNMAFLHCDWDRGGTFFHLPLADLLNELDSEQSVKRNGSSDKKLEIITHPEEFADYEITCPICMETYEDPRTLSCGHSICYNCIERMRDTGEISSIRCYACRKVTTIPPKGLPVNFSLKDAIGTLEKVRRVSGSNLRCSKCRNMSEESVMWICLKCSADEIFIDSEEIVENLAEQVSKKFAYCAQCILKYHCDHRVDELTQFRKRSEMAKELSESYSLIAKEQLEKVEKTIFEKLGPILLEPMKSTLHHELWKACDAVSKSEKQIEESAKDVLMNFERQIHKIVDNIGEMLDVLARKANAKDCSERPTQL